MSAAPDPAPERVALRAADGHLLSAFHAHPQRPARGGLVVVQSAYGVGTYLESVCRFYAENGWSAVAPALYDRQKVGAVFDHSPEGRDAARRFRARLVWDHVLLDLAAAQAAVAHLGSVCVVGFCVGGSAAWLAACRLRFAAAACYYGQDIVDMLDEHPHCPTILHFAEADHLISQQDVKRVRRAFPDLPVHVYPGGHGFDAAQRANERASSELARARCLALFESTIGNRGE